MSEQNKQSNRLIAKHCVADINGAFKNNAVGLLGLGISEKCSALLSMNQSLQVINVGARYSAGIDRHFQKGIMKESPGLNLI
jgi:hypothetical protein